METTIVEADDSDFEWMLQGRPDFKRRLRLPPGGVDSEPILRHVRTITAGLRSQGCPGTWMIVSEGEVVGLCGYTSAPSAHGEVEIGYSVAPTRRRFGHATRAVATLLIAIRRIPTIRIVTAQTAVDNVPSQRVLEVNGFTRGALTVDPNDGEPVISWRLVCSERRSQ